jgi:hypothetical protein
MFTSSSALRWTLFTCRPPPTHQAKQELFGTDNVKYIDLGKDEKRPKSQCLLAEFEVWCDNLENIDTLLQVDFLDNNLRQWKQLAKVVKYNSQHLLQTLQQV